MLYALYDRAQNRFIAEMEKSCLSSVYDKNITLVLGAVDPVRDGNYFKELVISGVLEKSGYVLGLKGWWQWAIDSDTVEMSDEFGFNVADVEIRELVLGNVVG